MEFSVVKRNWIDRMTMAMYMTHPNISEDKIRRHVEDIYDSRVKDTKVQIYNNYENQIANTSLLQTADWFQTSTPLLAESGVFFFQKTQKENLNVKIIKESMLDRRKVLKSEMFEAMKNEDMFLASVKDIGQANAKKAANSGYGAEGQSSSFLYNIHSAMSVTASGRGQISTACQCFENLLADNVLFFNMNEFFTHIYNIITEKSEWKFDTFDIITVIPSKDQFVSRFVRKFAHQSLADVNMIEHVYDWLDDEMRIRVYYKCNFLEFIQCRIPTKLLVDVSYQDVPFVDPNKVPKELKNSLTIFSDVTLEFVGYKYGVFRYEDRTKYQKRKVVIVIDTDSNMIYYGYIMDQLMKNILPGKLFKTKQQEEEHQLRLLNVLSDMTTKAITERLFNYLGVCNVPEEDRKHINMKNEYHMRRMIITFAKKSYIGLQYRQENVVFTKPKLDVKGVNFFKSTASEDTSKFIYDKILMKRLLTPKDGTISLRKTYRDIYQFQQEIRDKIQSGDMGYLKRAIKVKTPDAYVNPMRIGQFKAVYVWNALNDDLDRIVLPNMVTLVKVRMSSKKDLANLEKWPKIYKRMEHLFDTNSDIGDYMGEDGKMKKGKGIKSIALPDTYEEVPNWMLAIIDTETLVADNMALFAQLYRPLGMSKADTSHNGTTISYYSNIVRL